MVDIIAFRLCETVGCIHPDFLPDELSADHLVDWANYWAGQQGKEGVVSMAPSEQQRQSKILAAVKAAKGA